VLTAWIFSLGVAYLARFIQGRWKSMRVIEPKVVLELMESAEELAAEPILPTP